jgi:hypothetical protein
MFCHQTGRTRGELVGQEDLKYIDAVALTHDDILQLVQSGF